MLSGRRILIVEDESLIAMELMDIVEDANGRVVGPARSNRDAIRLIEGAPIDAALLDLNLADGEATPTAERLKAAGVPILVCTAGVLPRAMRLMWPDLPVQRKPVDPRGLAAALAALFEPAAQAASGAAPTSWRACSIDMGSPNA
ncbi:response regulator [Methylobacterium planeticum]|uniref:Response regulator n=1 Tax=Methylobacterium planeticum TaxID=2615211 RepID=A0A6N6MPZ0_9HYPH|nr:response regulator [Methylobacterium planeticum]KAB1073065.1 response regulator [Methylobacterium planeticum]